MIENFLSQFTIFNYAFSSELFLTIATLLLLVFGVRKGDKLTEKITWFAIISLAFSVLISIQIGENSNNPISDFFAVDNYLTIIKIITAISAIISLLLYIGHLDYNSKNIRFEYPIIIILAVIGMFIMVSAKDFLTLYLGLELQSLAIYILVTMNTGYKKSSEAGLKYFILGALGSGVLLYGVSLLYGFTSSIFFTDINAYLTSNPGDHIGVIISLVLILVPLLFKVSAVPFHMWTPDVYEGSPTPVTTFISTVPKLSAFVILFRVITEPLGSYFADSAQILLICAIITLLVGAIGATRQSNIKRLLAYSSINHVGFMLLAILTFEFQGFNALFIYIVIYMIMTFGAFAFVMLVKQAHTSADSADKKLLEDLSAYSGLSKSLPAICVGMAILMFSMSGIPPFAGFFSKFLIFKSVLSAGLYKTAILAAISAVIAAFYYLKIIKIMFFDEGTEVYDKKPAYLTLSIFVIMVIASSLFFIGADSLLSITDLVAEFN